MNNKDLAICFSANKAYLPHFSVSCYSFLKNNPGGWNLVLLSDDVEEHDLDRIRSCFKTISFKSALSLIKVNPKVLAHLPLPFHSRIGLQTYYRLLLAELLPAFINRALYLDSDLIVMDKLDITSLELNNHPIAGIADPLDGKANVRRNIEKYYNAGVLIFNIKVWRLNDYSNKITHYKPKFYREADQDLLNEFFDGQWLELPRKNNYPAFELQGLNQILMKDGNQPAIVHFIGKWKPWLFWFKGSKLYWKYLIKTPYWYQVFKFPITIFYSILYKLRLTSRE